MTHSEPVQKPIEDAALEPLAPHWPRPWVAFEAIAELAGWPLRAEFMERPGCRRPPPGRVAARVPHAFLVPGEEAVASRQVERCVAPWALLSPFDAPISDR
jgi:hypothetical protein